MSLEQADPQAWLQRVRHTRAVLDPWPAQALSAVLEMPVEPAAETLPPLWHWLYFLETAPRSRIGHDGHPAKGDFMPPVANPRRMFAGADSRFYQPLQLGASADLEETILGIEEKNGSRVAILLRNFIKI